MFQRCVWTVSRSLRTGEGIQHETPACGGRMKARKEKKKKKKRHVRNFLDELLIGGSALCGSRFREEATVYCISLYATMWRQVLWATGKLCPWIWTQPSNEDRSCSFMWAAALKTRDGLLPAESTSSSSSSSSSSSEMFWFTQGLCFLPAFLVVWSSCTFIVSYLIAIYRDDVDVIFPYIRSVWFIDWLIDLDSENSARF